MSRKSRGLSPEEEKLWQRVAKTASPLDKTAKSTRAKNVSVPIKKPGEPKAPAPKPFVPPQFRLGEAAETALPKY